MIKFLSQPWPWYVAGPLIGLIVPALLLLGNKPFGISSSMRHICAACLPSKIPYFSYNWKQEKWNLFFVAGVLIGGFIGAFLLQDPSPVALNPETVKQLQTAGVKDFNHLMPVDIFNWESLLSLQGLMFTVVGGFFVGFGTRYAGGCTSGHSIMGLSNLQWPSLVATVCFMAGGFFSTWIIIPWLLKL